jgi:hypothetical protein
MLKLIFVLLAVLLSSFSVPVMAGGCDKSRECSGFHNPTPAKPAVRDMVCIWFSHEQAGNVQIILYTQENGDITYQKTRWHQAGRDKLCFGAQRLQGVTWLVVCDDWGHATRGVPSITRLKEEGEIDVCALSDAGCA